MERGARLRKFIEIVALLAVLHQDAFWDQEQAGNEGGTAIRPWRRLLVAYFLSCFSLETSAACFNSLLA